MSDGATGSEPAPIVTEALIVGAGPAGLFHAFELGLLGIGCHIVDSLPQPGGQCGELYAGKPIYDIPGTPVCSGAELVERLLQQVTPFAPPLHLKQQVDALQPRAGGGFAVRTSIGTRFMAATVVIAGGVGSFQPRPLRVAGIERHHGRQIFAAVDEATALAERALGRVVIAGGGEPAVGAAIALAEAGGPSHADHVVLLHRRDDFDAGIEELDALQRLRDEGRIEVVIGQIEALGEEGGRLRSLATLAADGSTVSVPLDTLIVRLGWSPRLGPIADWGLALEKKQLVVDTQRFETSVPGIYAIGDINAYPGKKRLIVCGFHEATLAAFAIAVRLHPERAGPLQYTTTSPRLQALLKV